MRKTKRANKAYRKILQRVRPTTEREKKPMDENEWTPLYELNGKPVIRPPTKGEKLIMDDTLIEKVYRVKFLDVWIWSNGTNKHHIQKRMQASLGFFYENNLWTRLICQHLT